MAVIIEIMQDGEIVSSAPAGNTTVLDIIRDNVSPIGTPTGVGVMEVVGPGKLANTVVSTVEPAQPYEGQVWVKPLL
jgi:hypothetical protein